MKDNSSNIFFVMPALAPFGDRSNTPGMTELDIIKVYLMGLTGLERDALHIYVALTICFGSCLLFRWKTWQWKPWMLVLLAAILGELWDIEGTVSRSEPLIWQANLHDVWNTMLAPTVLLILTRFSGIFGKLPQGHLPESVLSIQDELRDQA